MRKTFKRIKIHLILTFAIIFSILFTFTINLSAINYDLWSISKDEVIKNNVKKGQATNEFTPYTHPKYENKIMNYIIALDKELEKEIKILRIGNLPSRDFLFVKDKLYCIKEYFSTISSSKLNDIIKKLAPKYGQPATQKDKNIITYTLSNKKSKILIITNFKSKNVTCSIYFYPRRLFKMLITDI